MLPLEIIDHIFSFLSTDLDSLESCCIADPVLAPIAERYFYRTIVLKNYDEKHITIKRILQYTCPEIKKILSENPLIANHVRLLNIWVSGHLRSNIHHFIDAITSILPLFTRVNKLVLSGIGRSSPISTNFIAALDRYMLLPSLMEVMFLSEIPFHLFSSWKNIKSLTFNGWDFAVAHLHSKPVLDTTDLQLESLSISNTIKPSGFTAYCALWAKNHVRYLRSLSFCSRFDRSLLRLFEICSASLTSLELDFGSDDFQTTYDCGVVNPPASGVPFNLSSLPHLQELIIHPNITLLPSSTTQNYSSSLPATIGLVKTSPSIQRLALVFEFKGVTSSTLPKIDLSSITIFANSSFTFRRMEIRMIASSQRRNRVPAATVLSYIMGDEELMRLYRQGVLFIPELPGNAGIN